MVQSESIKEQIEEEWMRQRRKREKASRSNGLVYQEIAPFKADDQDWLNISILPAITNLVTSCIITTVERIIPTGAYRCIKIGWIPNWSANKARYRNASPEIAAVFFVILFLYSYVWFLSDTHALLRILFLGERKETLTTAWRRILYYQQKSSIASIIPNHNYFNCFQPLFHGFEGLPFDIRSQCDDASPIDATQRALLIAIYKTCFRNSQYDYANCFVKYKTTLWTLRLYAGRTRPTTRCASNFWTTRHSKQKQKRKQSRRDEWVWINHRPLSLCFYFSISCCSIKIKISHHGSNSKVKSIEKVTGTRKVYRPVPFFKK